MNIKELYETEQYNEIIKICRNGEALKNFGEWDFLYAANALQKLKDYQLLLDIAKIFQTKFPESKLIDDKIGWAIYTLFIKDFDPDKGDFAKLHQNIRFIVEKATEGRFSPKRLAVLKSVEILLKKNRSKEDIESASAYLDALDRSKLSAEEKQTTNRGRVLSISSDKEKWYSLKTKILLSLGKYQECVSFCDEALKAIPHLHSRNDVWFKQRKIKSLLCLSENKEAETILNDLLQGKIPHWTILELAFDLAISKGEVEQAFIRGAEAALFDPSHSMRVAFYKKLADFWEGNGKPEDAQLLRKFVIAIRIKEGWDDGDKAEAIQKERELCKELESIWEEMANKGKKFLYGQITKILSSGFSGFIMAQDNNSYYFNVKDIHARKENIKEGQKVKFIAEKRLDKKKNKEGLCAVNIHLEK